MLISLNSLHKNLNKPKTNRLILSVLIVSAPCILLFIITTFVLKTRIDSLTPCWNDETSYWHEVISFYNKGLNFGYYTINELTPKFLSFGNHGFGTISIYTLYAKIFGWKLNSIVIANILFLTTSLLICVILIKPTVKIGVYIFIFFLTYPALVLYSTTSMTELMNFALVIVFFSLLYTLYSSDSKTKNKTLYFLLAFCFMISFIRVIYIAFFIPVLIISSHSKANNSIISLQIIGWIFVSLLIFFINSLFVSPFPSSFLNELFSTTNFFTAISLFFKHIVINLLRFFYPFRDESIQIFQRYTALLLTVWLFVKYRKTKKTDNQKSFIYFSTFSVLFLFLLITICAYDVFNWRDYRVISPLVFGIVLFISLFESFRILRNFIVLNLVGLIFILSSPMTLKNFFQDNNRHVKPLKNEVLAKIYYDPTFKSKFKNTLVINDFSENVFLNTPAGIGITHCDTIKDNLKSEYIYSKTLLKLNSYLLIYQSQDGLLYKKK